MCDDGPCGMNLYLLTRPPITGYDIYYGAVVAAGSAKRARNIHPGEEKDFDYVVVEASPDNPCEGIQEPFFAYKHDVKRGRYEEDDSWCRPGDVIVTYIGKAKRGTKEGVILKDYFGS